MGGSVSEHTSGARKRKKREKQISRRIKTNTNKSGGRSSREA